jgi:hypothetical protein
MNKTVSQLWTVLLLSFFFLTNCGTVWERTVPFERSKALIAEGSYEAAYQENHKILSERTGAADVALFNMGMVSAHSLNPRRDYPRALSSFTTLVNDYPQSPLIEQARLWIQVLRERQKLAEDKKTLIREREMLSQEKDQHKYAVEKSRQIDLEVEKLRRQR